MTDVSAATGEGFDAAVAVEERPPPTSPELTRLRAQVDGYRTQLAEADDAIVRAQGKVSKAEAHVVEAGQGVARHQAERDVLAGQLAEAEAAVAAHEGN